MSDLKWRTTAQLKEAEDACQKEIDSILAHLNGQRCRLQWIRKYLKKREADGLL